MNPRAVKITILAVIFLIYQSVNYVFAQRPNVSDSANLNFMASYLTECGGKYYSRCNSQDLNQSTIFNEAKRKAKEENKLVLVVVGADWCPGCVKFSKNMEAEKGKKKFQKEKIILVKITSGTTSGNQLLHDLLINSDVKLTYIPFVMVVNPMNDEIFAQGRFFTPGSIISTKILLNKAKRKWKID
ncbi:MAG: thioredoxin family protein [Bacteriovoracaceae bacterium]|nr:thioredoxin family protein [Bacteriovoracaceae bacterium]